MSFNSHFRCNLISSASHFRRPLISFPSPSATTTEEMSKFNSYYRTTTLSSAYSAAHSTTTPFLSRTTISPATATTIIKRTFSTNDDAMRDMYECFYCKYTGDSKTHVKEHHKKKHPAIFKLDIYCRCGNYFKDGKDRVDHDCIVALSLPLEG